MFRPVAPRQLLVVGHAVEHEALQSLPILRLLSLSEASAGPDRLSGTNHSTRSVRRETSIDLPERNSVALAPPETLLVHGEQCKEDVPILVGIDPKRA